MKIAVGVPSSGVIHDTAAEASFLASFHHEVIRVRSNLSGPNYNNLLMGAMNSAEIGEIDMLAMMHADIAVVEEVEGKRWLDLLVEEMLTFDLDFISVPNAIKDHRGLTSSGIGDPDCRWNPFKRFTTMELAEYHRTFTIADTEYRDKFLLHNHALCLWDMRKPLWYKAVDGEAPAIFNLTETIRKINGVWVRDVESEDWAFSRALWKMGARTALTTRITLLHHGAMAYSNKGDAGTYKNGDEDTANNWRPALTP